MQTTILRINYIIRNKLCKSRFWLFFDASNSSKTYKKRKSYSEAWFRQNANTFAAFIKPQHDLVDECKADDWRGYDVRCYEECKAKQNKTSVQAQCLHTRFLIWIIEIKNKPEHIVCDEIVRICFYWWPVRESNPCSQRERLVSWPLDQRAIVWCLNIIAYFNVNVNTFFEKSSRKYEKIILLWGDFWKNVMSGIFAILFFGE